MGYTCLTIIQSCKDRNPFYAEAVVQGQTLRQLVEWLNFVEWKGDFVWQGLYVNPVSPCWE
jgi:hypothetical protein